MQSLKIKLPHVVFLVTNREKDLSAGSEWAEFHTHMTCISSPSFSKSKKSADLKVNVSNLCMSYLVM